MMAIAWLATTLALTLAHALAFLDATLSPEEGEGIVAAAARFVRPHKKAPSPGGPRVASSETSARRHHKVSTSRLSSSGSPKLRPFHVKLLAVHTFAILAGIAALLKHALPVSDSSCETSHKVMAVCLLLFDASIITFLLDKVYVTNGQRTRSRWENALVWVSRMYAWLYLPFTAIYIGIVYQGGTNDEGEFCTTYSNTENDEERRLANGIHYATNNSLLILQFFVLLLLFVRPMLARQDDTQSGGALYRRVILRNLSCTAATCLSYIITSAVVVIALINESFENDKSSTIIVVALNVNVLVVLCLVEISLPLGFSTVWKAFMTNPADTSAKEASHLDVDDVTADSAKTPDIIPVSEPMV